MIILRSKIHASSYGVLKNTYRRGTDFHKFDAWKHGAGVTLDPQPVLITPTDSETQVVTNIKNAFARWRGMNITAALVCADPIFNDHRLDIKNAAKIPAAGMISFLKATVIMHTGHSYANLIN